MGKLIDLSGLRFGNLVVIKRLPNNKGWTMWECVCDCGNRNSAYATHLVRGNTKSCGCKQIVSGENHPQWNGYGEISGQRWRAICRMNKSRKSRIKHEFTIDIKYVWELFLTQKRMCALSGIPIYFGKTNMDETTASLDRIDSKVGYVKGNVQWVHKDINRMKNIFEQKYFIDMCKKIASTCEIV